MKVVFPEPSNPHTTVVFMLAAFLTMGLDDVGTRGYIRVVLSQVLQWQCHVSSRFLMLLFADINFEGTMTVGKITPHCGALFSYLFLVEYLNLWL